MYQMEQQHLNSYELSRAWWNFCFDNPEKVKPIHSAIYFFAIEHCNRLGWKKKFGFPSQMVMEAVGVKNWRTYSKALNEIVEFGFIKMIEISKNQYSANIIAIVKNTKAPTKALDKALQKHSTKQGQSTVSINKQYNKEQRTGIFTPEQFLEWFNSSRTKLLQKPSNSNYLSSHDKTHLEILTSRYKGEDFGKAFHNLCNDKWANESNQIIPKHFLKPENFDKYLQIEQKPLLTKKQKINRGWAV